MVTPIKSFILFSSFCLLLSCGSKNEVEQIIVKEDSVILGYVDKLQRADNGHFFLLNEESQLIELNPKTGELTKHFEMNDTLLNDVWERVVSEYDYLDFVQPDEPGFTNSYWLSGHWEDQGHKYVSGSFDFVYNGVLNEVKVQFSFGFSALFDISDAGVEIYTFDGEEWPLRGHMDLDDENKVSTKLGTLEYGFVVNNGRLFTKRMNHAEALAEQKLVQGLPQIGELNIEKKNAWSNEGMLPAQFKKIAGEIFFNDGSQVLSLKRDACYHLPKKNDELFFLDFYVDKSHVTYLYFVPEKKKYNIIQTNLKGKEEKELLSIDEFGMGFCLEKDVLIYLSKDEQNCYLNYLPLL